MIELAAFPPVLQGATVVGAILLQAVVLYVGYAAVEQYVAKPMLETIEDA